MNQWQSLFKTELPLIVEVPKNDIEVVSAAIEGGADAVVLSVLSQKSQYMTGNIEEEIENINQIASTVNVKKGLLLGDLRFIEKSEWDQLKSIKLDFLAGYPSTIPPFILRDETLPLMLYTPTEMPLEFYRILGELSGVESLVFLPRSQSGMDVKYNILDIVGFMLVYSAVSKPILFKVANNIEPEDIQELVNRGASGFVLDPSLTGPLDADYYKNFTQKYKDSLLQKKKYRFWG
ncbi:MAG: hypothetical protein JRN26_01980 [Nitrososphaerota archaeon]|jgi:hypothetical protein|nr:hypothetical protein [Nitrososphaerota archaeon]MDG6928273.1 hypothetical protein [Nitrososphaerota archaeon]MDG6931183.1 hypothetical protein [Nitrososphaerota archaeon]MDG6932830.1 hypothetical protein [Nitrososphaerota archaeon]MDG6935645.1 hypothetical protein [Nitrososphaerota archaeon]